MDVLVTWQPATDGWTGEKLDGPYTDGKGYAEITDTWDFHSVRTQEYDPFQLPVASGRSSFLAFRYGQVGSPPGARIHRVKSSWSVSTLPTDADSRMCFLEWRQNTGNEADPGTWAYEHLWFMLDPTGSIYEWSLEANGGGKSTFTITPGQTYEMEIVITCDYSAGTVDLIWYVDGVIWYYGTGNLYNPGLPAPYSELEVGYTMGTDHVHDITVHFADDLIYTIEGTPIAGRGGWTMMYVG